MQRKQLLAYTSWLAKHQRLTFAPENLVEAYLAMTQLDVDEPAA